MSKWHRGKVEWFDKTSGEGYITDIENGKSYYVHYSSIISDPLASHLRCGDNVKFTVAKSATFHRVDLVKAEESV